MLHRYKQLPELYFLRNRHNNSDVNFDYETNILKKSLSSYIFKNDMMNSFIQLLEPLVSLYYDNVNIIKNFKNYMVDKNEYRQKG
jgi:hypothetical protein